MSADNGWPDPARPGVPLNPEQDGWHWVQWPASKDALAVQWGASFGSTGWIAWRNSYHAHKFRYLGPCLTPEEVAAREAAVAEAMRKAAADCARRLLLPDDCGPAEAHGRFQQAIATCEAIRALPLPAPNADEPQDRINLTLTAVLNAPRCGDRVRHNPSGETWVVAYADALRDKIAWAGWPDGWPDGIARLSDCEVVYRCPDEEHREAVEAWRKASNSGRRSMVLALYDAPAKEPGA